MRKARSSASGRIVIIIMQMTERILASATRIGDRRLGWRAVRGPSAARAGWNVAVFERAAGDLGDRGTGIGTRDELFAVMRRIGLAADASLGIGVEGRLASTGRPHRPRVAGTRSHQCLVTHLAAAAAGAAGRLLRSRKDNGRIEAGTTGVSASSTTARAPRAISWSQPTDCIPRLARSLPRACATLRRLRGMARRGAGG